MWVKNVGGKSVLFEILVLGANLNLKANAFDLPLLMKILRIRFGILPFWIDDKNERIRKCLRCF